MQTISWLFRGLSSFCLVKGLASMLKAADWSGWICWRLEWLWQFLKTTMKCAATIDFLLWIMSLAYNALWYHFSHSRIFFKIWVNLKTASTLSTKFIQYSKPSVVILTIFTAPSLGVASISRSHFAHPYEATPHSLTFYHEISGIHSYPQRPLLIHVPLLFPHLQSLPSLKPSESSVELKSTFSKLLWIWCFDFFLPMNHEYL